MATAYTLQRLFSPSKKYESILNLWDDYEELDDEQYYRLLISDALIETQDYQEISLLQIPESISVERANIIATEELENYFDHCDDLPVFPNAADCSKQLNAPMEFIETYVNRYNDQKIWKLLPNVQNHELTLIFEERLKELYESVKQKNKNQYYLKKVSLIDLHNIFGALSAKETQTGELFDDEILIEEIKTFCNDEIVKIEQYDHFIKDDNSKNNSLLFKQLKEKKITQLEAVTQILNGFF